MRKAAIDIGSNSVLLLIADVDGNTIKELANKSHITSLGRDLDKNKVFHQDSMNDTMIALEDYVKEIDFYKIPRNEVLVYATEASRVAQNAKDFFKLILSKFNLSVQIIDGEKEAELTTLGVLSGIKAPYENGVIMDMGGASTEFIQVNLKLGKILKSISYPFGSVRAYNWQEESKLESNIQSILNKEFHLYKTDEIICVAGGMTSIAAMFYKKTIFNDDEIDGKLIELEKLKDFFTEIEQDTEEKLLVKFPFLGKRAKVIKSAFKLALIIFEQLSVKRIRISTRGLRYGALSEEMRNEFGQ